MTPAADEKLAAAALAGLLDEVAEPLADLFAAARKCADPLLMVEAGLLDPDDFEEVSAWLTDAASRLVDAVRDRFAELRAVLARLRGLPDGSGRTEARLIEAAVWFKATGSVGPLREAAAAYGLRRALRQSDDETK